MLTAVNLALRTVELRLLCGAGWMAARLVQRLVRGRTAAGRAEIAGTLLLPGWTHVASHAGAAVFARTLARLAVKVENYNDNDCHDNSPCDDEGMVEMWILPQRLTAILAGLDPASGRRLGFGSQHRPPSHGVACKLVERWLFFLDD